MNRRIREAQSMEVLTGVFDTRREAEKAVNEIRSLAVPDAHIGLVTPNKEPRGDTTVPVTDTEYPGMGTAMGAAVGGAMGAAGGATLGLAAATLIIPGIGPVMAFGLLGAALLGGTGAVVGAALGDTIEEGLGEGLPHEDVYLYEYALRRGKSVVVVHAEDSEQASRVRALFNRSGAMDLERLRDQWWSELRDTERSDYSSQGGDFETDEVSYRKGFAAAQHRKLRGTSYEDSETTLKEDYPDEELDEAFRRGYDRGVTYYLITTETREE
ncbi:MAG TPA: hypothetical protein VLE19_18135 [Pyrinomonadaceae bacterium]|nr:hypothetical protein [Pyrinomonadaceae bacterium]